MNYLTQGDTTPVAFSGFAGEDGTPVPTNTVQTVTFSLRNRATCAVLVSAALCQITSSGTNQLACEWRPAASDLDAPGTYDGELTVTYTNGKQKHFPGPEASYLWQVRRKLA